MIIITIIITIIIMHPVALKHQDEIRRGILKFYGHMKHSLALVGNHLEIVSQWKYHWLCNVKFTRPLITEISNQNSENYSVITARPVGEGSSLGRSSFAWQRGPIVIALMSEQSGLRTWIRLSRNLSLESRLLTMMVSRLEDTGN